ncbi:ZIP family metal transporter [Alkaliphilus peptidifermentans]|uniref:Zinc transporter, ZIP family n=1 Tax=Alkaliphilus peptidifermentans DSM 18978 TaxID=1120976 RepID=A0A1G5LAT4_9FIRM|nr:ZIP family metal transporter [Alkaliphilus peptidifermentans]SCZ09249.1 zinc transporter, ZIP family [Alkaliphilus peptidifermentans DSM 18978]
MSNILRTALIGLLVGIIGTGIGGSMAFILKNPSKRFLSSTIGLSSGLMIAIVTFELLPEAFMLGGMFASVIGIGLGAFTAALLDSFLSKLRYIQRRGGQGYIKTGILLGIGIALHNFPEGLAIGSGFVAHERLGIGLAIVIALHNMPEGLAMVTPMRAGGYSRIKSFSLTLLAGAPMGIGALAGAFIGEHAYWLIGTCLAFAGGTMLFITLGELIPKGKELDNSRISTFFAIIGFMVGILISKRF